ncbi:MAG TPA: HD domain-containing protein [Phycisphaerae bacterium]|nr:HD domain-containing protein [Phycisphaerae bacterium]
MPEDKIVRQAWAFCVNAHREQKRDDGRPYHTHPEAVVKLLQGNGICDPNVLAAAYLHDVLEDTDISRETLHREFGQIVTGLVDELTNKHPSKTPFHQKHAALLSKAPCMSDSAKVIKLADRLHNLTEMGSAWPFEKQNRYLNATVELLEALRPIPPSGNSLEAAIQGRIANQGLRSRFHRRDGGMD